MLIDGWPLVVFVFLKLWKRYFWSRLVMVGYFAQEMCNTIETRSLLIVSIDHEPWGKSGIRVVKHHVLCLGEFGPFLP